MSIHLVIPMLRVMMLLTIFICIFSPAMADVAIEGVSQYNYQYHITNYADYPDYAFITSSAIWGWEYPQVVMNGSFGGGYKLDGFILHAVPLTDVDDTLLDTLAELRNPSPDGDATERASYAEYMSTIPVVTANVSLPVGTFYEDTLEIANVSADLTITTLNESSFNLTKDTAVFEYQNGEIAEVPFSGDADPIPPSSS